MLPLKPYLFDYKSSSKMGISILLLCLIWTDIQAQTYPVPGFTLPAGKTIVITYEVDVNANSCPTGTLPTQNISNQSNVSGSNFATVQTDDPDMAGASNPTLTPFSSLSLGNLVYQDNNRNSVFDAGDAGINGVLLNLYLDNGDGILSILDGAPLTNSTTAGGGLYSFSVCPGIYIVEVAASNFLPGGTLYDNGLMAALVSSPLTSPADPDFSDTDNDDNGNPVTGFGVASATFSMAYGTEPDGVDMNTNNRVDFGFKTPTTVTINDVTMQENTGGGTTNFNFTITRNDNSEAFNLTVNSADGTAVSPSDFTAISGATLSFFGGGSFTQNLTVLVNQDNIVEANETFTILLSGAPASVLITDGSGLGTITNDDASVVTLTGTQSLNEGAGGATTDFTFQASLNNPVQGGFTIAYNTNDGSAQIIDSDYSDNDNSIIFTGTAGESHDITVVVNDDNKVEINETFTVSLGAISGAPAGVSSAGSPQTGTILNDDSAVVTLSVGGAGNMLNEGNAGPTNFVYNVTLNNPVQGGFTIAYSSDDGTATLADNDYINNDASLIFAGTAGEIQNITIQANGDLKVEANETFTVNLGAITLAPAGVTSAGSPQSGTILNDDSATVTLTGGGAANEGNTGTTPRVFTATLNNPVQGGFSISYATTDGTATTADSDYADNDGPDLVFAGTANETELITVLVNGDLKVEANETFTVTLGTISGAPAGVTVGGTAQTGTISNDEIDFGDAPDPAYPTLLASNGARHNTILGFHLGATIDGDLDAQQSAMANGDGADEDGVTLPAVMVTGTTADIVVNATSIGLLNAWVDFNDNGSWADPGEQIFTNTPLVAGNNNLSFAVPPGAVVGTSFARFRLSSASGLSFTGAAADGEVEDYQVNILNNQFSIDNPIVTEGDAGTTTMTFTVSRTTNANDSSVDFDITGGTATSGTDYTSIPGATINFLTGGSLTETIEITVNGDIVVEDNETIIITLSNPVNGGLGTNPGTGTINNDDSATITLSGGDSQNEGASFTMTATLSAPVQGGFTVAYASNDGTATTANNDYANNDGSLVFAGNTNETQTFIIASNVDNTVELDETFTATLGAISGTSAVQIAAISIAGSPQTDTILNNDAAVVNLVGNYTEEESFSPHNFTVSLSNPVDVPVTVLFSTADNTAFASDNDYVAVSNQTVTFPANTTTAQFVPVTIVNDNKVETDEIYNVSINTLNASSRNVVIGTSTAIGTIENEDQSVVTLSGGVTWTEGNSGTIAYVFTATLLNPVQGGLTVNYTTNDGTAMLSDNDYVNNDGSIGFAGTMGESHNITVLVNGDLNIEFVENFNVAINSLSSVINPPAVFIAGSPQTGTILNDEQDWGDAPDTYSTISAPSNGARHGTEPGALRLGATIDADLDGQPNATATGDGADEDGVTLPSAIVINTTANITVNASGAGLINAWVDYNLNGNWTDPGEQIFTNQAVVAGNNALSFPVPGGATLGNSFARFRLSTASGLSFTGYTPNGEVEDYAIEIVNTQFSISDPMVTEGNAGTVNLVYEVSRNVNVNDCSVNFIVSGGTASQGDFDFQNLPSDILNFSAGGAFSQTITIVVNGDNKVELDETVEIALYNPVDAGILDGLGVGTIVNDDAATVTITNPSIIEGDAGTSNLVFTVMLNNPVDAAVDIDAATLDGLATLANLDYVDFDETITILANTLSQTATVLINGDCTIEPNENFSLELSNIAASGRNVIFSGGGASLQGTGTILNDDVLPVISCLAEDSYNTNLGTCDATIMLDLPTVVTSCGTLILEFRYRSIDDLNVPTGPFTAYIPSSGNTITIAKNRYEIQWRITDGSGSTNCSQYIEIFDLENPSIICPGSQTLNLDGDCEAILPNYTSLATNDDNCGGNVVVQLAAPGTTVSQTGTELITLTVTDENGNSNSCTFNVSKIDAIPPVVVCQNDTVNFNGETTLILTPSDFVTATDNCGIDTIAASPSTVNISQLGQTIPVTLTVTDLSGNSSSCVSQVTIGGLPPGWSQNENGVNCEDGNNVEYQPSTQIWTMSSTGCFYGPPFTSDELAYAQYTLCGNGQIVAQVTGISGSGLGWAGVSMRESTAAGSKKVQLTTNLSNFSKREVRSVTGGASIPQQFNSLNRYWLKIVRTGNQFVGYTSPNGVTWYNVMAVTVPMNSCIQLGLVLTNYNTSGTVNATFANVSTVGSSVPLADIPSNLVQVPDYEYSVYPNPSNGKILVDLGDYVNKEVRLELVDTYGRIVFVKNLDVAVGTENIDLNSFTNGIYFLKARSPGIPDNIKKVILLKN
ncbi:MAG: HYR domain-containing protein [Saprospiraceae bacterium]|nr:HYR domain-containing protein [Saprospiraceae bacterium]